MVSPLVLRRTSSGSMRAGECRLSSARSNDWRSWTVASDLPRLTSWGRLPSVMMYSEPSSRRSTWGMRWRNSGSMWSAR